MDKFSISERQCSITYANKGEYRGALDRKYAHYGLFHRLMNFMRDLGYSVEKDPEVLKEFPSIAYSHWYGSKGELEFCAEYYPAGFDLKFFQNVNFENRNGGRYDFDRWDKMPYHLRLEMIRTMRHIREFFNQFPIEDITKPYYEDAENKVKQRFVVNFHKPKISMDFDLHDLDGTTGCKHTASYNLDRDGKEMRNGQIKYTRDFKGYLVRGRVYYDLNMNWIVILNKYSWIVRPCWELFDLSDSEVRGRDHHRKTPPKEFQHKMEILHGMKTSWLESELRRRRRAVHENT